MPNPKSPKSANPIRVVLVSLPETASSSLTGIYDVLTCFDILGSLDDSVPRENPFRVEIVEAADQPGGKSIVSVKPSRKLRTIRECDIVIVPSLLINDGEWETGRYPDTVKWLTRMHAAGALLCSACSGVMLLAETGLLNREEATLHWAYAPTFRKNFPDVKLRLDLVLLATGKRQEIIMSGASASWHDLVLYLVARLIGPTVAQAISKFMLLQWHSDGQNPYVIFQPVLDHGDAEVLKSQQWLAENYSVANPVEQAIQISNLAERSFKRRFTIASGMTPISYVQQLRIGEAKRRLERTRQSVNEISWQVGYEDAAFFHRLFKRLTGLTPAAYRRKFQLPAFARL